MLTLNGKMNRNLGEGIVMTTRIDMEVNLCSLGGVSTKGYLPEMCIGDVIYTKEIICRGSVSSKAHVVFQQAEDFNGYRLSFFKKNFDNKFDAYKMCVDFLNKELGICTDSIVDAMPIEGYEEHGICFAKALGHDLKDSVYRATDLSVAEFKIFTKDNLMDDVKKRINQVFTITASK